MIGRALTAAAIAGAIFVCGVAAYADTDVLLQAVGFAVTGNDDAFVSVIGNRTNCVFAIKNEIYHLNNVHTDRLKVVRLGPEITFTLHGSDVVFEETIEPQRLDSEIAKQVCETDPDICKSQHNISTQHELHLPTAELERVKRAWEYIYSHGCAGATSPF
jgi:hypothetical protein